MKKTIMFIMALANLLHGYEIVEDYRNGYIQKVTHTKPKRQVHHKKHKPKTPAAIPTPKTTAAVKEPQNNEVRKLV